MVDNTSFHLHLHQECHLGSSHLYEANVLSSTFKKTSLGFHLCCSAPSATSPKRSSLSRRMPARAQPASRKPCDPNATALPFLLERFTTSTEAKPLAVGAYRAMKGSLAAPRSARRRAREVTSAVASPRHPRSARVRDVPDEEEAALLQCVCAGA